MYVGVGGGGVSRWGSGILHMGEIPLMGDCITRGIRFLDVWEFEVVAAWLN